MTLPKITPSISTSNYFQFDGRSESLNMLNASTKLGNTTFTVGLGVDSSYKFASNTEPKNNFAVEAKVKYNISENLNAQARFRKIGATEQYRLTFGGNYNFDKKNSIYGSLHLTEKFNNGERKTNTGAWFGYTHNFNDLSVSLELQQNVPLPDDGKIKIGLSDTLFNLIVSIPLK